MNIPRSKISNDIEKRPKIANNILNFCQSNPTKLEVDAQKSLFFQLFFMSDVQNSLLSMFFLQRVTGQIVCPCEVGHVVAFGPDVCSRRPTMSYRRPSQVNLSATFVKQFSILLCRGTRIHGGNKAFETLGCSNEFRKT